MPARPASAFLSTPPNAMEEMERGRRRPRRDVRSGTAGDLLGDPGERNSEAYRAQIGDRTLDLRRVGRQAFAAGGFPGRGGLFRWNRRGRDGLRTSRGAAASAVALRANSRLPSITPLFRTRAATALPARRHAAPPRGECQEEAAHGRQCSDDACGHRILNRGFDWVRGGIHFHGIDRNPRHQPRRTAGAFATPAARVGHLKRVQRPPARCGQRPPHDRRTGATHAGYGSAGRANVYDVTYPAWGCAYS